MTRIKKIAIITEGFPTKNNTVIYKFLEQIVSEFAKEGIQITVINPIYHNYIKNFYKYKWSYKVLGNTINVYQPIILNYSARKIGKIRLGEYSYRSFKKAVERIIQTRDEEFDALYAHFLMPSGCVAAELGALYNIPAFCAVGESNVSDAFKALGTQKVREKCSKLKGIISVSTDNKTKLEHYRIGKDLPIIVLPNGVDQSVFYSHDKIACRKYYGFDQNDIIGIFVGAFIDRKGPKRVEQASKIANIKMIYIGSGDQIPMGDNIIFKGAVDHDKLPTLLSSADFFVLPTRAEGCCNAILEAISCGLPIISSIGKFNDDILSPEYSIRVDPDDIKELSEAMKKLSQDSLLRRRMSECAIQTKDRFNINNRAKMIISFMDQVLLDNYLN